MKMKTTLIFICIGLLFTTFMPINAFSLELKGSDEAKVDDDYKPIITPPITCQIALNFSLVNLLKDPDYNETVLAQLANARCYPFLFGIFPQYTLFSEGMFEKKGNGDWVASISLNGRYLINVVNLKGTPYHCPDSSDAKFHDGVVTRITIYVEERPPGGGTVKDIELPRLIFFIKSISNIKGFL